MNTKNNTIPGLDDLKQLMKNLQSENGVAMEDIPVALLALKIGGLEHQLSEIVCRIGYRDIMEVKVVSSENVVNDYLTAGWQLLQFQSHDHQDKSFVVGWPMSKGIPEYPKGHAR